MSASYQPNSLEARDIRNVLHPYTDMMRHAQEGPVVITKGEGVYVFDDEGNRYIEGISGLWCTALGFSERRLVDAAVRQMSALPYYHVFMSKTIEPAVELAEKLVRMAPGQMSKVLFSNSGSEANDAVVKLVWYFNNAIGRPKKKKIISRLRGYHGVTVASASLTGIPSNHIDFDLPMGPFLHTDCPHYYLDARNDESEEEFAARMADNLESLILREGPETIALFIAEPVMGAGGVIMPPRTYFEKVQEVLRRYDILFAADEVICGFGRTGEMFGCETYQINPDFITVAKSLSSAYLPISAVIMNERIADVVCKHSGAIGVFAHGVTYAAHPVCAAVALETLRIIEERELVAHAREVGTILHSRLREFAGHPMVGDVRAVGLLAAVELSQDPTTRAPFDPTKKVAARLVQNAQEHGLILRAAAGDVVAFCPPLIITEEEIHTMVDLFGEALHETYEAIREEQ